MARWVLWWVGATAGCAATSVGDEPAGPRAWDGAFLIDSAVIDCDGFDTWTYDVWMQGWGDLVTVEVAPDPFSGLPVEYHQLPEVDFGDGWALHSIELDQGTSATAYAESEATAVPCEAKTFVTYVLAAWRYDGDLEECVAWGLDPAGIAPQCSHWGEVGHRRR